MILASAKTKPKRGDIKANLLDHYRLIALAAEKGADLIVFPEMSITGYEREEAAIMAFSVNDSRLNNLKKLAVEKQIIIVAGAPLRINFKLFIGTFIFLPDHTVSIYTKQFLHAGEEAFFTSSFDYNPLIKLGDEGVYLAICADIDHPSHPEKACKSGSTIYLASLFFTPKAIPEAHNRLSNYAKKYFMNVLMSNYCGESRGFPAGGKSAFWTKQGELIAETDTSASGLVVVERVNKRLVSFW